jgi:hypothetical protein
MPRRPSAKVKQRLFPAASGGAMMLPTREHSGWVWLAPATCALLLTLSLTLWITRNERPGYMAAAGGSNMLASLSFAYATDTRDRENVWTVATFDQARSNSSISTTLLPLMRTNAHF